MIKGLWELLSTNPILYTNRAADIIRDRKTNKEYVRGKRKLFHGKSVEVPKTIEELEPDRWEFIYFRGEQSAELSATDYAREIYVNNLFRRK